MKYYFKKLKSLDEPALPVTFAWDSETGEFSGPDGEYIEDLVDSAYQYGSANLAPCVNRLLIEGTPLSPEDLSAILGQFWEVNDILPTPEVDLEFPAEAVS